MELKHIKPLVVASILSIIIGAFLIISGLLEFTGIISTPANNDPTLKAVGIQLSYLVFVSGILSLISGGLTLLARKKMESIDLQIFVGVVSLAWPIFVSIAIFFAALTICLRLLPTMLSSLFYMITVLIVKISNEALRRSHKFNPSAQIANMGKRKQRVDVAKVFNSNSKKHSSVRINTIPEFFQRLRPKRRVSIGKNFLFSGQRRKHSGKMGGFLYSGSRRRGKFRIRK